MGGADFTGARGGKQSSSTTFFCWLFFFGFLWLNAASLTMLGIGRGLLKVPSIFQGTFQLK